MRQFIFVTLFKTMLLSTILCSATAVFGQKTVFGVVTDIKNVPIVGASVAVKNSTIGTTTDLEGSYTLLNVPDSAKIVITNAGYVAKEIKTVGKTNINAKLSLPKRKRKLSNRGS